MRAAQLTTLEIGPLMVRETGERRVLEAETLRKRERSGGIARIVEVSGVGIEAELADITFANGSRDVRMLSRRGCEPLDRLVHGLRIGVHAAANRWFVELRIPAAGERKTVTGHQANLVELDRTCQVDTKAALMAAGATGVDRRELAVGDKGRRRNELCAVFEVEDGLVPVAAYAITPLLAYWYLFCDGRQPGSS